MPHAQSISFVLIDHWIVFVQKYKSWSSSVCSFLQSSVSLSLLGPDVFLSTLVSNMIRQCASLNVGDTVIHPFKTVSKIIVLFFFILCIFCRANRRQKILDWMTASIPWDEPALNFTLWMHFYLLGLFPIIWTSQLFQMICYLCLYYICCVLFMRCEHILSHLSILLLVSNKASVFFWYIVYVFAQ